MAVPKNVLLHEKRVFVKNLEKDGIWESVKCIFLREISFYREFKKLFYAKKSNKTLE